MYWPQTEDEFIVSETKEYGFEWVDEQFARGYEPKEVNGVWLWRPAESVTPIARNTSTIPHTPVNLIITMP